MRRSYRIIPTYTGDVSGACSALFELGGMVVMHDPSGCNSTYNTHDETRWYDQDSLVFLSGLTEMDAILGNDEKLVDDVVRATQELRPRFVALASSPIPYLNGTDFPGLCRLIEGRTGVPAFFVPTNGMHDYVCGAGQALKMIAERFVESPRRRREHAVNLLGVTPLDFAAAGSADSLRRAVEGLGWEVVSCWAMGDDLDALARAGEATVNLVTSAVGLAAAKELRRRFGTPYVCGIPVDGFGDALGAALARAAASGTCEVPYLERGQAGDAAGCPAEHLVILVGEPVTMGSLAAAISARRGVPTRVLCPLERCEGLLGSLDKRTLGEEDVEAALGCARAVVADPLYQSVCPPGVPFYPLPHQAFSGRCFCKTMQDWMGLSIPEPEERRAS